jgi:hypothetical protein
LLTAEGLITDSDIEWLWNKLDNRSSKITDMIHPSTINEEEWDRWVNN